MKSIKLLWALPLLLLALIFTSLTYATPTRPVISGIDEIIKSRNAIITTTEILQYLKAIDETDGNITNKIKIDTDSYTGNGAKTGTYSIFVSATNNAGARARKEIKITVINDKAPWFIIDKKIVNIETTQNLERSNIIDLLTIAKIVTISPRSNVIYSIDTYSENIGLSGTYALSFTVKQPNATQNDYNISVNATSIESDNSVDVIQTPTLFSNVVAFVKLYWLYIAITLLVAYVVAVIYKVNSNKKALKNQN